MANGFNSATKRIAAPRAPGEGTKLGSRRIFAPLFKLQVLDSYRHDADCKGNQRATARKYGIHRRQIQKWLQAEAALRGAAGGRASPRPLDCSTGPRAASPAPAPVDLSLKRPASPRDPAAWDLSWKPAEADCEPEAPPAARAPAAPQPKPFKLFRPYLLDGEDEPPSSAFARVAPRHCYSVGFELHPLDGYRLAPEEACGGRTWLRDAYLRRAEPAAAVS